MTTGPRNATVAVIGAGDYIGSAIARRFAAGGYQVFAGRRNGEKLAPLVTEITAAGGRCDARAGPSLSQGDARASRDGRGAHAAEGAPRRLCLRLLLHLQRRNGCNWRSQHSLWLPYWGSIPPLGKRT